MVRFDLRVFFFATYWHALIDMTCWAKDGCVKSNVRIPPVPGLATLTAAAAYVNAESKTAQISWHVVGFFCLLLSLKFEICHVSIVDIILSVTVINHVLA